MQIDELKTTSHFLNGVKLKCLLGKIHPTGLGSLRSEIVAIKVPKSGSKVFLVGGDGASPSVFHREGLDRLKEGAPNLKKLKTALEDHMARIMTPSERIQNGLQPIANLIVAAIVVDDVRKLLFLTFASNEPDVDEHGLVAVRENAGWRLETGDFISHYTHDAVVVAVESKSDVSIADLIGIWEFDEKATADLLRRQGDPEKFIQMSLKNLRGTEWVVTESEIIQKHSTYLHAYRLVSVESKKRICQITVNVPGLTESEVWKLKITNCQIIGAAMILKKRE